MTENDEPALAVYREAQSRLHDDVLLRQRADLAAKIVQHLRRDLKANDRRAARLDDDRVIAAVALVVADLHPYPGLDSLEPKSPLLGIVFPKGPTDD